MKKIRDICELTPAYLHKEGITALLVDLDNTLAGYREDQPDETVCFWLRDVLAAGITVMVISNAKEERAARFCKPLGLPYIAKAGKPGKRGIESALRELECKPDQAMMVGDQMFTDIWAGKNAGVRTVLVDPRTRGFWTAVRRGIEIPLIYIFCWNRRCKDNTYTTKEWL